MLKKGFKSAKCKTALKLATSRIKLMRNKKLAHIVQIKKELAQLLESGQDRTARIRVEHVIREEKMVAAYDLIEIYCELIVARLPIIESQKTCPIDLKEAVTSVIFAAPRCSDISELVDAKKNFTAKYGKEFVSAAIELRPDCGVSRMLVEKLSAVAPDVQTKVKVLSDVAKEHNINWDPTLFEEKESKPPDDLLQNVPTYFEKASTIRVDSPKIQTSNPQNVHSHEGNPNGHFDFSQQNKRFTADAHTDGLRMSFGPTTHDDMSPSGLGSGVMNTSQLFHSNNSNSSPGRENWNTEFKDATSAAHAAAEAAERASIAARAAMHLSSQDKITRQYSNGSYTSEQNPEVSSEYTGQHSFKGSYSNTSFNDRKPKMQNQQMGPTEIDTSPKSTTKSSSLRPRTDSVKENSVNHFETHETSSDKESRSRFTNGDSEGSSKSADVEYFGEQVVKKQPSITPSRAHSTTLVNERDDLDFYQQKAGQRCVIDQEKLLRETTKYDGSYRDDETDSDDGPKYDMGFDYDEGEAKTFFPSPDRESFYQPEKTYISIPSPKRGTSNTIGRVGSGKSVDHSVKFGISDGPDSETETEMIKSRFSGSKKSTSRVDPAYVESPPKVNPTKSRIELNDLVENTHTSIPSPKRSTGTMGQVGSGKSVDHSVKLDILDAPDSETETDMSKSRFNGSQKSTSRVEPAYVESPPKVTQTKSRIELSDLVEPDDFDTGKDFRFSALTGGLRNKGGLKYPPYTKTAVKEHPVKVDPPSKQSSFDSRASRSYNKKTSVSISSSESDSDDHNEAFPVRKPFKTRPQFTPPDKFFSNDETDSEKEESSSASKQTSAGRAHLGSGLSWRTKRQVEPPAKPVISNPDPSRESLETSSTSVEQKWNMRSNIYKSSPEPRPDPTRFKQEPSRTKLDPKISKSPPSPTKKIVESRKTESPKALNTCPETKPEASNVKKPSHVHPKLPEYDLLAARIQALSKMNHQ
ncbi:hypothetical protein SSX86_008441 [Deinandra increscens subsp. villosa]|uniref:Vacuolar protein sorting-associated protein Ist1 n=1 Tax=Deinandra increscens subsp. villosa TaxID=3103831 RepID=A0AAP0DJ22_9ASTR